MKYLLPVAMTLLFCLSSCVNDDLSDCDMDKRVKFHYTEYTPATYNDIEYREGINPAAVTRMNLFIFDEAGKYVKEVIDEAPKMSKDYYMTVSGLQTGDYKFIAWGSLKGVFSMSTENFVPGVTTFNEVEIYLNSIRNGLVTDSITPLFYASHPNATWPEIGRASCRERV